MKKNLFAAIVMALTATGVLSAQPGVTVVSRDTIRDGEIITIITKYSNGLEMKQSNDPKLVPDMNPVKPGQQSPGFTFPDIDGKNVSLGDLKGKFVLIDVWATWCGPCKQEIPHLEALAEKLHGRDIAFVSISVDKDRPAWENMVREKHLGGIQLHAGEKSDFVDAYKINGIPRFILLDPDGVVIAPNCVRPSNPDAYELFDNLVAGRYTLEQAREYTLRGLPKKDITGQQSPVFNYPDIDGRMVSLNDFKGKYVLVDIWATWCGPCKAEIPHLRELEKKMHGRNIAFVSISVDQKKPDWEKMVREDGLAGTQLYFNGDDSFMKFYRLNGIPRFILLDRAGRIIDDEMKVRPSNPAITDLLDGLEGL